MKRESGKKGEKESDIAGERCDCSTAQWSKNPKNTSPTVRHPHTSFISQQNVPLTCGAVLHNPVPACIAGHT